MFAMSYCVLLVDELLLILLAWMGGVSLCARVNARLLSLCSKEREDPFGFCPFHMNST